MATFWRLPQCAVVFHVKHEETGKVNLAVAGGREPAAAWLKDASSGREIYCADRGGEYCLKANLPIVMLIGDCDSTSAATYFKAQSSGAEVLLLSRDKDDTDLQLLLKKMPEGNLLITGIFGGRFDHLFSNVYSLLAFKKQRECSVVLADEQEILLLLEAGEKAEIHCRDKKLVQAISLLPLSAACRVSIDGVRWPLSSAPLTQGRPYAVSNEPLGTKFICECVEGSVGFYIHWQK